jgi:hypothetical protein
MPGPAERLTLLQDRLQEVATLAAGTALARLPREERATWARLWADVADLLEKADGKGPPQK